MSDQLPEGWCCYCVNDGVDTKKPGIYQWRIEGAGSYIGKYGRIRRPTKEYRRNLIGLLNSRAYRKANPDGYRRIHRELASAHRDGRRIELIILENVCAAKINERERELIKSLGNLNGPNQISD
jgi:hypothetical protein